MVLPEDIADYCIDLDSDIVSECSLEAELIRLTIKAQGQCLTRELPADFFRSEVLPWDRDEDGELVSWIGQIWHLLSRVLKKINLCYRAEIKSLIQPIKNCCLLPVIQAGQFFLYKIDRAEEVLDLWSKDQCNVLRNLEIPEIDRDALGSSDAYATVKLIITSFEQPDLILSAVSKVYAEKNDIPMLNWIEMESLLLYFADNLQHLSIGRGAVPQLKQLPFYKTVYDDLIALSDCSVYVLPNDTPTKEMETWRNRSSIVFLKSHSFLKPLYTFIGCAFLDEVQVYCEFIFNHFEYLSEHAQFIHLKYLSAYIKKDKSPTTKQRWALVRGLQNLNFIKGKDGKLHPASYFYDPEVDLFTIFIATDRLPSPTMMFRQSEWLAFLRSIGLKSHVTLEMYIKFASGIAVEAESDPKSEVVSFKSEALVRHVLSSECSDEVLRKLRSIRFIAPNRVSKELSDLHPQYGDLGNGLPYLCFEDSYLEQFAGVIWTNAEILPGWANPKNHVNCMNIFYLLGIEVSPPADLVIDNFKRICSVVTSREYFDKQSLKKCCIRFYEFLDDHSKKNLREVYNIKEVLSDVPCIFVGGKELLAKPCQTVVNIKEADQMRPYLFKTPYEFRGHGGIFISMGTMERPTINVYCGVLQTIFKETNSGLLTPYKLQLVYKAIKALFDLLAVETESHCVQIDSFALLGDDGCLYKSCELAVNDAPWYEGRICSSNLPFLFDLAECGIRGNPKEIIKMLPSKHRPQMLSCSVKEILDYETKSEAVATGLGAVLQQRINNELFKTAIVRLAKHQARKTGEDFCVEKMQNALDYLHYTLVLAAGRVTTYLQFRGKPIKGSSKEKKCFLENGRDYAPRYRTVLYVRNDLEDTLLTFAENLGTVMGDVLKASVVYLPIILKCEEGLILANLDNLGVLPSGSASTGT